MYMYTILHRYYIQNACKLVYIAIKVKVWQLEIESSQVYVKQKSADLVMCFTMQSSCSSTRAINRILSYEQNVQLDEDCNSLYSLEKKLIFSEHILAILRCQANNKYPTGCKYTHNLIKRPCSDWSNSWR